MYRIVNDKIQLTRGETPTYNVRVINKETGAPFTISPYINNPVVEFVVRPSIYSRESEFVFKAYLDCAHLPKLEFDAVESLRYENDTLDVLNDTETPSTGENGILYYINAGGGERGYAYYDGSTWKEYEFRLLFQFPYWATSVMEPKTYAYQVTLLGGVLRTDAFDTGKSLVDEKGNIVGRANSDIPIVIDYNKPLLDPTEFTVGGSVSE